MITQEMMHLNLDAVAFPDRLPDFWTAHGVPLTEGNTTAKKINEWAEVEDSTLQTHW